MESQKVKTLVALDLSAAVDTVDIFFNVLHDTFGFGGVVLL